MNHYRDKLKKVPLGDGSILGFSGRPGFDGGFDEPPTYTHIDGLLGANDPPPGTRWRQGLLMDPETMTVVPVNSILTTEPMTGTTITADDYFDRVEVNRPQIKLSRPYSDYKLYGGTSSTYFEATG